MKALTKAYRAFFIDAPPGEYNQRAAFSVGDSMEGTRFYFSDASIRQGFDTLLRIDHAEFDRRITKLANDVNFALRFLIVSYLRKRCGKVLAYAPAPKK
jgi:hypothetical protein